MWKNLLLGKKPQQVLQPRQARTEPLADVSSSAQNRMRSTSLPSNLDNIKTDIPMVGNGTGCDTFPAEAAAVTEEADAIPSDKNLCDGTTSVELNSNLYQLLSSLFGVSGNNSIVQLVAQKFNISEQLAGEITAWFKSRSKEIQLQNRLLSLNTDRDEEMESTYSGDGDKARKTESESIKAVDSSTEVTTEEDRLKHWKERCFQPKGSILSNDLAESIPFWFENLKQADKEKIVSHVKEAVDYYNGNTPSTHVKADLVAKFNLTELQAAEIYDVVMGVRTESSSWATDYRDEVLKTLFEEENEVTDMWRLLPSGPQRDAYIAERVSAVDVMTDFATKFKLEVKTVEAAIRYLDRLMMSPNFDKIIKPCPTHRNATGSHSLYTIALCVLFISSKFEEIYPPQLSSFTKWCHTSSNMEQLEGQLLEELGWDLSSVTPTDFIGQFHEAVNADRKTKSLSMFILEAAYRTKLTDQVTGSKGKWNFFHKNGKVKTPPPSHIMLAKPSEMAVACLCLSLAYQGKISYTPAMADISRASSSQIGPLVKELHEQLWHETYSHNPRLSPIVRKYTNIRYNNIGTFRPPTWIELVQHNAFRETEVVPDQLI